MQKEKKSKMNTKKILMLIILCFIYLSGMTACSLGSASKQPEKTSYQEPAADTDSHSLGTAENSGDIVDGARPEDGSDSISTIEDGNAEINAPAEVTIIPSVTPEESLQDQTATTAPVPTAKPSGKASEKPTGEPTVAPTPTTAPTEIPTPTPEITAFPVEQVTPPTHKEDETLEEYASSILDLIIDETMSEVEQIKMVHDYIVLNTEYDEANLLTDTLPKSSFSAEGVLFKNIAVCQGYAEAFDLFMEVMGIDCEVVIGYSRTDGISHAWNIVSIGGRNYNVDTTWDDPVPDRKGKIQYNYFLMPDSVFEVDHSWKRGEYSVCTSQKYMYYIYEEYIIDTIDDYEKEFIERYKAGERTIMLLYPEEGKPDLHFMLDYKSLRTETVKDNITTYSLIPCTSTTVILGDYTMYTIYFE
ncbi:MAG: transglutaminase domain-containing protein [Mobilitalea sp.]